MGLAWLSLACQAVSQRYDFKTYVSWKYPTPVPVTNTEHRGRFVEISDLVGASSNFLFDKLDFDRSFLKLPVNQWENDDSFLEMKEHVKNMRVCNDPAERGLLAWSFTHYKVIVSWDLFRQTAPRCPSMAAGAVSLRKYHDIVILSFCNIVKGQANSKYR